MRVVFSPGGNLHPLLKSDSLKKWLGDIFENRPGAHFQNKINNIIFQTIENKGSIFKLSLKTYPIGGWGLGPGLQLNRAWRHRKKCKKGKKCKKAVTIGKKSQKNGPLEAKKAKKAINRWFSNEKKPKNQSKEAEKGKKTRECPSQPSLEMLTSLAQPSQFSAFFCLLSHAC